MSTASGDAMPTDGELIGDDSQGNDFATPEYDSELKASDPRSGADDSEVIEKKSEKNSTAD